MADQTPITLNSMPPTPMPPTPIGRRRFIGGVVAAAGAGMLAAGSPVGVADAAVPVGASKFVPLPVAVRVVDTRQPLPDGVTRLTSTQIRLQIGGNHGVPSTATALVATVTGVNWGLPNFVSVFPSGALVPEVSTLNMSPWDVTANLSTVRVSASGSIDLYSLQPCDVIYDVIGYYEPVAAAIREGRFKGLPVAQRAIDTRPAYGGAGQAESYSTMIVELTAWVPQSASSAVINLTATECTGPGYFTVFPYTEAAPPNTSSLNVSVSGATRASSVIVPVSDVGGSRFIKIYTLTAAQLIVDVTGYFTGLTSDLSQNGLFVPVDPVRILDTRTGPGPIGKLWPNWVVESTVLGSAATEASAIIVNLTGVASRGPGYLTIGAARFPVPQTSNLNFTAAGAVVPNHAITPITSTHGFQVFSSHGAHVLVDYAGYFTGIPEIPKVAKIPNPPPPSIAPPWLLTLPTIGVERWINSGDSRAVTNAGLIWHWTGTGDMGQDAHAAVFGHRTEHGGPFRNLHLLQDGDLFYVTTLDGRQYTYTVVRRDLTNSQTANILDATRFHTGTTMSLIACTKPNFLPTSLSYRIVLTGELVGWTEV